MTSEAVAGLDMMGEDVRVPLDRIWMFVWLCVAIGLYIYMCEE